MTTETEMMESMRRAIDRSRMLKYRMAVKMKQTLKIKELFEENGVMTYNTGFMVKAADGSEFQVTVQQSK